MWFSTQDGLNRFDGEQFMVFKSSASAENSLADNYIYPLVIDDDNNLWLGTRSAGVDKLSLTNFLFSHFSASTTPLMQNRITALRVGKDNIWVGTYHGDLHSFDLHTQTLSNPILNTSKPIYAIEQTTTQQLWLGTHGNGLIRYDLTNHSQTHFLAEPSNPSRLQHNSIFTILEDDQQRVWVGTQGGGLHRFINEQLGFKIWQHNPEDSVSISHNEIRKVFQDSKGHIWVGTRGGGLNKYDEVNDHFTHFKHDATDKYSLAHDRVYTIFEDANQLLWIGTANGVSRFDPFSLVFEQIKAPEVISNKDVWSIFQDSKANLWVGSWGGGLDKIEQANTSTTGNVNNVLANSIQSKAIKSIIEDTNNQLWVGTWGKGLERINLVTGEYKQFLHNKDDVYSLSDNNIFSLLIDNKNQLWIGTDGGGLNRFDVATQKFHHHQNANDTILNIPSKKIFSIFQDSQLDYWVGTDGQGLFHFNPQSGGLRQFSTTSPQGQNISHNTVRSIHEDNAGDIWFGTSNGIHRLSRQTQRIQYWGVAQGLPNQVVYAIESGLENEIWFSTNKGISRLNITDHSFTNFKRTDGTLGNEFNAGASVKLADGRLAFGGNSGVTVFSPANIKNHNTVGNVALIDFKQDNHPLDENRYADLALLSALNAPNQTINIDYEIDRLSMSFAYLKYVKPDTTEFKYRLKGFDKSWQRHVGKQLHLEYTNLDDGDYQLEIIASQIHAQLTSAPYKLNITVSPAPWNSWWAYTLYTLLLIFSVFGYIRWQTLKVAKHNKVLEQLVKARTKEIGLQQKTIAEQSEKLKQTLHAKNTFFTNVSHELRTPLSLIIAPLQRLISQEQDQVKRQNLERVLRNGERLKSLVNKLLSLSHGEALKKAPISSVNLSHVALKTAHQFQSSFQHPHIHFDYDIEPDVFINANEEGLESILINLLGNSYKYTQHGFIKLSVNQLIGDKVVITITDSGIGISKKKQATIFKPFDRGNETHHGIEGSGIGLSIVKDLCQQFHGDIHLVSEENKGSCFQITFNKVETQRPSHAQALTPLEQQEVTKLPLAEPSSTKKSILIVEDNPDLSEFLCSVFATDYQVSVANNGQQGLDMAKQTLPDIIISDIMMPVMDGIEMLQQVNAHPLTCHIPVILLTAKNDQQTKLLGLQSQALDFIHKPFDHHELQLKVHNWLDWREQVASQFPSRKPIDNNLLCPQDQEFINKLELLLSEHYTDHKLEIDFISKEMAVSPRQLQRKLKSLTNQSPIEYLRNYRIERGKELLIQGLQVAIVAEQVGFSTSSYFAKVFKTKYQQSPKSFQKSIVN